MVSRTVLSFQELPAPVGVFGEQLIASLRLGTGHCILVFYLASHNYGLLTIKLCGGPGSYVARKKSYIFYYIEVSAFQF